MWLLQVKWIKPHTTVPQDVAAHLICSHQHQKLLRSLVHNSCSLWNNNHILDLYKNKFIIITLYPKMLFSLTLTMQSGTTGSTTAHIGTNRRHHSRCVYKQKPRSTQPAPRVWCRCPGCWEPSSLHECSVWTLWGPGSWSVSSSGPSQCEAWLGCQFWPARF